MSVNIYDASTDTLKMASGRVADAYTKAQTNGLVDSVYDNIGDAWVPGDYTAGKYAIDNNILWRCARNNNLRPSLATGGEWVACKLGDEFKKITEVITDGFQYVTGRGTITNTANGFGAYSEPYCTAYGKLFVFYVYCYNSYEINNGAKICDIVLPANFSTLKIALTPNCMRKGASNNSIATTSFNVKDRTISIYATGQQPIDGYYHIWGLFLLD